MNRFQKSFILMERITKIKIGLGVLVVVLFGLGVYLGVPIWEDIEFIKEELPSCQESLDVPDDLVFKYSCYWEDLGIYQEIHLELDDFETYNDWYYKLKNDKIYKFCEIINGNTKQS